MDADGARGVIRETVARLGELDVERERVAEERDRALVVARECGVTWRELSELSGLSRTALNKAVNRVNG